VGNVFGYKEKYSQNNIDVRKSDLIDKSIKLIENLIKEIKKRKNK
jgi:oligoendopeptidase F